MNEITENAMSSLDLVAVINEVRAQEGKGPLAHDNFIKKIESHPKITSPQFLRHVQVEIGQGAKRASKCYFLPRREADLMVMSESRAVQAGVYDRMRALEAKQHESFQAQLAQAQAKLLADFEQTKKDTITDFLRSLDITYFGKRGTTTPERKYFALLELDHLKLHATAFKYRVSIQKLQEWKSTMTKHDMERLAELVKRQYPAEAIRWDIEEPDRITAVQRVEQDKLDAKEKRRQKQIANAQRKLEQLT